MKKIDKVLWDIYTEMYQRSEPPAVFEELVDKYKGTDVQFYKDHYLPMETQEEIMNKHLSKSKLSKYLKQSIRASIFLGVSPTSAINEE